MNEIKTFLDSYLKYMLIVFVTLAILYIGRALFIPLSFGLLIALILYPLCNWLEKHKWPRSLAIFFLLMLVTILFIGLVWLLIWQFNYLKNDIPFLAEKLRVAWQQLQQWFNDNIGVAFSLETDWLENATQNPGGNMRSFINATFKGLGSFLFALFIIPVFSALFLYHRQQFVQFLKSLFPEKYHQRLHHILHETSYAYYKYIIGLIKVYFIVGALNSIGLLALGIEHAILFGMLSAFMTMIPYVGIIISSLLPITVAWLTKDSLFYPLGVIAVFAFVQYLENIVIFPKVVGRQLNVSTLVILVALIAGGIIWGLSGMILFMPFVAILKIISDDIEELKPLNILLSRSEKSKKLSINKST